MVNWFLRTSPPGAVLVQDAGVLPLVRGSADGRAGGALGRPSVAARRDATVCAHRAWSRRYLLARRPDLADGVLRAALRCVARWYRGATGRSRGKSGSVTVIQHFGSALNLNLHFHIVHLDGVYDRGADGKLRFFQAPLSTADIEGLVVEIALSCERWLAKQGFGCSDEDTLDGEDDASAVLQQASLLGTVATGERAGKQVRRVQRLGGREFALPPRCAAYGGYNVHANVSFSANDRDGLERLCRYVLRPPLAVGRLEPLEDGRVRIGMKRAWASPALSERVSRANTAQTKPGDRFRVGSRSDRTPPAMPNFRVSKLRVVGVRAG